MADTPRGAPDPFTSNIWRLKVPLEVTLAETEIAVSQKPPSVHIALPRHAYLAAVIPPAMAVFQEYLAAASGSDPIPWFSHRSQPVRPPYLPLGILHDALSGGRGPLRLVLHLRGYPRAVLPDPAAYGGGSGAVADAPYQATHFNALKEAACVCAGTATPVLMLTNEERAELWGSAVSGDLRRHRRTPEAVRQMEPLAWGTHSTPWIPVRALFAPPPSRAPPGPAHAAWGSGGLGGSSPRTASLAPPRTPADDPVFVTRPVPAFTRLLPAPSPGAAAETSVLAALEVLRGRVSLAAAGADELMGQISLSRRASDAAPLGQTGDDPAGGASPRPSSGPQGDAATEGGEREMVPAGGAPVAEASSSSIAAPLEAPPVDARVLCCGVEIPWEAPIRWLHSKMAAPDGFLYLVFEGIQGPAQASQAAAGAAPGGAAASPARPSSSGGPGDAPPTPPQPPPPPPAAPADSPEPSLHRQGSGAADPAAAAGASVGGTMPVDGSGESAPVELAVGVAIPTPLEETEAPGIMSKGEGLRDAAGAASSAAFFAAPLLDFGDAPTIMPPTPPSLSVPVPEGEGVQGQERGAGAGEARSGDMSESQPSLI